MEKHIVGEEEEGGVNGYGTEENDAELELGNLLSGSKLSASEDHPSEYSNARRRARSPPPMLRSCGTAAACVRCFGHPFPWTRRSAAGALIILLPVVLLVVSLSDMPSGLSQALLQVISGLPSDSPSTSPSASPSRSPSDSLSAAPSADPSTSPSGSPSSSPSAAPSASPSMLLSISSSAAPSDFPPGLPSNSRTAAPSDLPSRTPSVSQSDSPSGSLTSSFPSLGIGRSNGVGAEVSPQIDVPKNRRNALDPEGEFSFVHISKAAGSSWIASFTELPLDVCPKQTAGPEYSVWFQTHNRGKQGGCEGADHNMLSLRSPRHHVWSLFTECKYDGWGHKVTKGTGFPRSGTSPEEDVLDFEAWLDHFLPMDNDHIDHYRCYHPANYQSRHLDTKVRSPHGVVDMPDDEYRFEPNLDHSLATYWNQDFVPVVELFHESSCLLYYRLGPEAPPKAILYLEQKCRCPQPLVEDETLRTTHVTHHELGHRSDLRHLPDSSLSKIETLTRVDRELYLVALQELLGEFSWLESPAALGRRVLCEDALDKWEPELAYLGVSLRAVYKKATERTR